MRLLDPSSYEDYGMSEYIKKIEKDKQRMQKSEEEQMTSLELFHAFDGGKNNYTTSEKKQPTQIIDEQSKNIETYHAMMNHGKPRGYSDLLDV